MYLIHLPFCQTGQSGLNVFNSYIGPRYLYADIGKLGEFIQFKTDEFG
jgi:hypothetical protein